MLIINYIIKEKPVRVKKKMKSEEEYVAMKEKRKRA